MRSAAATAAAQVAEAVEAESEAAFIDLQRVCDDSQSKQEQLVVCCASYQRELCHLEAERPLDLAIIIVNYLEA